MRGGEGRNGRTTNAIKMLRQVTDSTPHSAGVTDGEDIYFQLMNPTGYAVPCQSLSCTVMYCQVDPVCITGENMLRLRGHRYTFIAHALLAGHPAGVSPTVPTAHRSHVTAQTLDNQTQREYIPSTRCASVGWG